MSVFARDFDDALNGDIEYKLALDAFFIPPELKMDKDILELFTINQKSGVIQTAQKLDREKLSIIRLKVFATDKGVPPMNSSSLVEINVLDANDNSPIFEQQNCVAIVPENITIPAIILTVKATDADSGNNGKIFIKVIFMNFQEKCTTAL